MDDSDEQQRAEALGGAIAELGDSRAESRRTALAKLEQLYVQCDAGQCVTDPEVARATLPAARRALGDPDPEIRITGARAIQLMACDAASAIPELLEALADAPTAVRLAVLEALCEMGSTAAAAAGPLAWQLRHAATPEERAVAAHALGNTERQAEHVEALLEALLGDVPAVQACAADALSLALQSDHQEIREAVSQALRRLSRPPTLAP